MIQAYYNLKKTPFDKNIPTDSTFTSASLIELEQRLEYIKQKRGIMLITGQPGTGKSLAIRTFISKINLNLYKYFYIPLSTVNILDFYRQLCTNLGGVMSWKKSQLFASIQASIRNYVENNQKVPIIIFDEAHFLKNENFWELQIINNFNLDSTDPAIFILVAQPHLKDRLLSPLHQAFYQRITLKFHLSPLSKEETNSYIQHHLKYAGATSSLFNPNAVSAIYQASNGIPRVINSIAFNALTIGALERKDAISEEEIYRAVKEVL